MDITFITGNEHKTRILEQYLGYELKHQRLDLDEIQSFNLHDITGHKVRQAFKHVKSPVLVEDVSVEFKAFGQLPGPFIKWFLQELGLQGLANLLKDQKTKEATAKVCFAYFDGKTVKFFDGEVEGTITDKPRGQGFGWNPLFMPSGSDKTYAEMDDEDMLRFSLRTVTVFPKIRKFLEQLN